MAEINEELAETWQKPSLEAISAQMFWDFWCMASLKVAQQQVVLGFCVKP